MKQNSLFWVERLTWDKLQWEIGTRIEQQKIAMDYNLEIKNPNDALPAELTAPHKTTAYSYATGLSFTPNDKHKLTLNLSHQERLPNVQELYAHGKHLATNSFDTGNKNLTKEQSNNIELAWAFTGNKWDFNVATYYNDFDNYIYLGFLNDPTRQLCLDSRCMTPSRSASKDYLLRIQRYYQSRAKIYGAEAEIGYQFVPHQRISLFGDYVCGKLRDLPSLPNGYEYDVQNGTLLGLKSLGEQKLPDGNAPRMPASRLGVRYEGQVNDNFALNMELYHQFKQDKVAHLEQPTAGYNMLNVGASYQGQFAGQSYRIFAQAHNVLNAKSYNHASFLPYIPQMGRSFSLGMNWKL